MAGVELALHQLRDIANFSDVGHRGAAEFHDDLGHLRVWRRRILRAIHRRAPSRAQPGLRARSSMAETSGLKAASVDDAEIAKFNRLAAEWWDPNGKFRPLHQFNPVRLQFIREAAASHFSRDARSLKPFGGLTLLDIGCGGGLLSEPMARLGFTVLGA